MRRMVDSDVLMGFISEAKGYLPDITEGLAQFQANPTEFDLLEEPYRYTHTIKGASSMVGLMSLSHISFQLEETLEKLSSGQLSMNSNMATMLLKVVAVMDVYLDEAMLGEVNDKPLLATATQLFRRIYQLPVENDGSAVRDVLEQFGFEAAEYELLEPLPVQPPAFQNGSHTPASKSPTEALPLPDFAVEESPLPVEEPGTLPEFQSEAPEFEEEEPLYTPEPPEPGFVMSPEDLAHPDTVDDQAADKVEEAVEQEVTGETPNGKSSVTAELQGKETTVLTEAEIVDAISPVESPDAESPDAELPNAEPTVEASAADEERETQELVTPVARQTDPEMGEAPAVQSAAPDAPADEDIDREAEALVETTNEFESDVVMNADEAEQEVSESAASESAVNESAADDYAASEFAAYELVPTVETPEAHLEENHLEDDQLETVAPAIYQEAEQEVDPEIDSEVDPVIDAKVDEGETTIEASEPAEAPEHSEVEKNLAEENLAEENLIEENLAEENLIEESLTEESLTEENLAEENPDVDAQISDFEFTESESEVEQGVAEDVAVAAEDDEPVSEALLVQEEASSVVAADPAFVADDAADQMALQNDGEALPITDLPPVLDTLAAADEGYAFDAAPSLPDLPFPDMLADLPEDLPENVTDELPMLEACEKPAEQLASPEESADEFSSEPAARESRSPFEFFRETDDVPKRVEAPEAAPLDYQFDTDASAEMAAVDVEAPPVAMDETAAEERLFIEETETAPLTQMLALSDVRFEADAEPEEASFAVTETEPETLPEVETSLETEAAESETTVETEAASMPLTEAPEAALTDEAPETRQAENRPPENRPKAAPVITLDLPQEIAEDLREVFMMEAEDHLKTISLSLAGLIDAPNNRDLLQEVRRSAHSLKGSAAMVGFKSITQLAHRMEDLLDLLYDGDYGVTENIINLLFASSDALEDMTTGTADVARLTEIYEEFETILSATGGVQETPQNVDFDQLQDYDLPSEEAIAESFAETDTDSLPEDLPADDEVETFGGFRDEARQQRLIEALSLLQESLEMPEESEAEAPPALTEAHLVEALVAMGALPAADEVVAADVADTPAAATPPTDSQATTKPMAQKQSQTLRVPLGRLDEMVKLVSELVISRTAFEQRMADFERLVEELQGSSERLKRVATKLETQYEASTLGGSQSFLLTAPVGVNPATGPVTISNPIASLATFNTHGFDDLEFDRYTEFHLLSREVSETSNDIQTLANEYQQLLGDFDSYLTRQGRLYSEVQDKLMRTRMVPLSTVTARLHRAVRNVADSQGKLVHLVIEGEETQLDKSVLEEIADSLQHILRNAVGHGIEPPELRQVQEKPREATIRVRAFYEGTQVVIQISDDGVGIDPGLLRMTAVRRGYTSEEEALRMSNEELLTLIFVPGFSTSEEISEVSGRGVGMDIVKATVHKLKGSIAVSSVVGEGTTFTIHLPMMLAITRALMVKANNEVFAVPLSFISQIIRVVRSEIEQLGDEPVLKVGGESYAVHYLAGALNLQGQPDDGVRRPPVLLMNLEGQRVAVCVDHLLGGHEIVVKNLGNHLRAVKGVSGATVMGDGSVMLILNPAELFTETTRATVVQRATPPPTAKTVSATISVLIVDDSPSVRRVVSNVIKSAGWEASQAKDGLDALETLHQAKTLPDVMLLDIEMPRMDGYELLKNLRAQPEYKDLPVVMLTSRAGEKHREKAFAYGATEYLVKPYQDETLLGLIRKLATERRG